MAQVQVAQSEMDQLAIHLLVCVHIRKALINHQGGVGAQDGGPLLELRMPYKAVCVTQRGAEGWGEGGLLEGWSEGRRNG